MTSHLVPNFQETKNIDAVSLDEAAFQHRGIDLNIGVLIKCAAGENAIDDHIHLFAIIALSAYDFIRLECHRLKQGQKAYKKLNA
jgi:hypothetical protein